MSGTRIDSVAPGRGVAGLDVSERAIPARRALGEAPRMRVARISEATATYDFRGSYPASRLFQVTKPLPERPYAGTLLENVPPEGAQKLLGGSYQRTRSIPPQYVDTLQ